MPHKVNPAQRYLLLIGYFHVTGTDAKAQLSEECRVKSEDEIVMLSAAKHLTPRALSGRRV
jgi:hypothetical protein